MRNFMIVKLDKDEYLTSYTASEVINPETGTYDVSFEFGKKADAIRFTLAEANAVLSVLNLSSECAIELNL